MAWCYYCRRYTVNGRCPDCGRLYQDPNKNYDFYGKEIKSSSSSKSNGSQVSVSSSFMGGFWLGFVISGFAIIIAHKKQNREMKRGAIVGTIINAVLVTHLVTVYIYAWLNHFEEIIAKLSGG